MDQYRVNQILRVAKLYYETGESQASIAKSEHLSKSTVSRLIQLAKDLGYVKISIEAPQHAFIELENELCETYHLARATILPDVVGNKDVLRRDVCAALADDLSRMLAPGSVLGVAWGHTMSVLAELLTADREKALKIIQLNGGFSRALYDVGASQIVRQFVEAFGGEGYLLPAPAIVDAPNIADAIKSDSSVDRILKLADVCDAAIYSLGNISEASALYQMGYFTQESYDNLRSKAVGDICSHFVDAQGQIADVFLDARTVATPLAVIKKIPHKFVVAVGPEKAPVLRACLAGGFADYLYADQPTAMMLLQKKQKKLEPSLKV